MRLKKKQRKKKKFWKPNRKLPSWRNWYTHMLEVHGSQGHAGSSPAEGTKLKGGSLAQLVERFAYIEDAVGSSPTGSTCKK